MIACLRYILSMWCCTVYHSARLVLAGLRGVPFVPGGIHDQVPRDYGQALIRWNRLDIRAEGLEQILGGAPCVYVSNHLSWFDIPALLAVLPGSLRFVAKQELMRVPLFGAALRTGGHIAVDRRNLASAVAAYESAGGTIRSGRCAVVFVEGTRSRDGRLQAFKKGPFVLAIVAQVPVIPVVVVGSFHVLPRGSIWPRPGTIVVRVGQPISTLGMLYEDRDRLSAQCRAAMVGLGAIA
ncbi:MAG: lysophospholipid acyltransferase family protein [Gemmatimonadota bacterium]|nr:lysophospholipid acyltransferase family protein [Gemmatimonadota bacterium]